MTRSKFGLDKPTSSASQKRNEKVTDYTVVKCADGTFEDIVKKVKKKMKEGWVPQGPLMWYGHHDTFFYQTMVKY
jgi:hypothetical protein